MVFRNDNILPRQYAMSQPSKTAACHVTHSFRPTFGLEMSPRIFTMLCKNFTHTQCVCVTVPINFKL
jgi:hypothetical protein